MKHRVVVAETGIPDVPPSERIFAPSDLDRPWDERLKAEVEVDDDEPLGSILRRAGEELDRMGSHGAEPEPRAPTYFGIHVEGERTQMWNELTFLDQKGRIRWQHRWQDEPYSELLRAVEGGALPGDPARLYFIRLGGVGDGFVSGFPEFIHLFHIWWELLKAAYEAGGAMALFAPLFDSEDDEATGVIEAKADEWQANGGQPFKVRELIVRREGSSPADLSQFLGITKNQAASLLKWFGSREGSDGRWRVGDDEASQLMAKMVEFVLSGGRLTDDAFREAAQKFADEFAETGKAPDIDWDYIRELPLDPKWSANIVEPREDLGLRARIRQWFRRRESE